MMLQNIKLRLIKTLNLARSNTGTMVLSFCKLSLLVIAGQLCLSSGFVFPSTSTAPSSASSLPKTFLPSSVTADDMLTSTRRPNLPFRFTERAARSTQPPVIPVAVQNTRTSGSRRRSLPKLDLHVEDSELGDVVDIILELRELLVPEPSALASMGKLLEVTLLHMTN
jgi:hypothetical protein